VRCQAELAEKNKEIQALTENVQTAYEETESTRQALMNRLAAKEIELGKAQVPNFYHTITFP
jgi:uncharacterized protein YlxW (UPF0749 family)